MIVGITGTIGSGKGTIAGFLEEFGFKHVSARSYLEKVLEERGLKDENLNLLPKVANELRKKYGSDYIFQQMLLQAQDSKHAVIESIRSLGEVESLERIPNSCLIAIDADKKLRYDRINKQRKSSTDNLSFKDFCEKEDKQMSSDDPTKQNLSACMARADYIFINNFGSDYDSCSEAWVEFVEGKKGFVNLFKEFSGKNKRRPDFDENFMMEAYIWGHRSSCLRREVGAVLTKENRFISQGYNGPARGVPHCEDQGGCLREQLKIPSGMRDEICRAIHAEINSLLNASSREERQNAKLHITTKPCTICSRIIANSGIKEVKYWSGYNAPEADKLLKDAGIKITPYSGISPRSYTKFWQ